MNEKNQKRSGVWVELDTLTEPNTGLSVVITERFRGRVSYSIQLVHKDEAGSNKFLPYPVPGLDKIPTNEGAPATTGDVIKALVNAAEEIIRKHMADDKRPQGEVHPKPQERKREPKGSDRSREPQGLSALARADAERKGFTYKSKSQRKKEAKAAKTS